MTITIPDELHAKAESKAKKYGFASVEDYLSDLVEFDDGSDWPSEPIVTGYSHEELGRLLQEGIDSGGAIEVNEEFWQRFHEKIRNGTLRRAERHA